MPQPIRTVWAELWEAHPILYTTLTLTSTINTTLLSLLLIAFFSTTYDTLCTWARRRRQTHTYTTYTTSNTAYTLLNSSSSALQTSPFPHTLVSHLVQTHTNDPSTIYTKAALHTSLYLAVQHVTTAFITRVARILASIFIPPLSRDGNANAKRQCDRLLERGLDCAAVLGFHGPLVLLAAGGVLCVVRGVVGVYSSVGVCEARRHGGRDGGYSPGFLRLVARARDVARALLAVPGTVVWMYGSIPRDGHELRKHVRFFLIQVLVSGAVFLVGNVVCAVAALPDFQATMEKLHRSGITGNKGV